MKGVGRVSEPPAGRVFVFRNMLRIHTYVLQEMVGKFKHTEPQKAAANEDNDG